MKQNILFTFLIILSNHLYSQSWSTLGTGMQGTTGVSVNAELVYNSQLIAAGRFITAGGDTVNNIARWDGSIWHALGTGVNGTINCMAVYNGELYVAGVFSLVDTISVQNIAKWNGTSWSDVANTQMPFGEIRTFTVDNNYLIAGGDFPSISGVLVYGIAKFNGSIWSDMGNLLGSTMNDYVTSIVNYNGDIYACGTFQGKGNLAKWDGTYWDQVGGGLDARGQVMIVYNSKLYVGGLFTHANGNPARYLVTWDGTTLTSVGTDANHQVNSLAVNNTDLYAGGGFDTINGVAAKSIAKFNGSTWSVLSTGLVGPAYALCPIPGDGLYAGGIIYSAGGISVNNIAKWSLPTGVNELEFSKVNLYPNPNSGRFTIQMDDQISGMLNFYLPTGEKVGGYEMSGGKTYLDLSGFAKGLYYYEIIDKQRILNRGRVSIN